MQLAVQSLSQMGYYFIMMQVKDPKTGKVKPVPQLLSGKGQMTITCDDGIVYTLRFGESRVSTGSEDGDDKKDGEKKTAGVEQRYLFVTAKFEESALGDALKVPEAPPGFIPEGPKKDDEKKEPEQEETPEVKKYREDLAEYARKAMDREKKIGEGKKRAKR